MRKNRTAQVGALLTVVGLACTPSLAPVPANAVHRSAISVVGDNDQDAYHGTGGLLLPGSFSGSLTTRVHVADCMGCQWRYTIHCAYGSEGMCQHSVSTCQPGQIRYRVWFGQTAKEMAVIGSVCWGSSTPVIRTTLERTLRDHVVVGLPPLRPGVQPSGGTLTSVPATFFTRQPTIVRSPNLVVTGMVVRLYARPVWHWLWGDGSALWTAAPGQPHPSTQVQHQYRTPGLYLAQVQTNWSAVYTVDDLGPFTTTGDLVTQQSTLAVRVLASRVLLAPWS